MNSNLLDRWKYNFQLLYNNLPTQRIGGFEIIKINSELFLIEHKDNLIVWMAVCEEDESSLYMPLYKQCLYLSGGKILIGGLGLGCDLLNVASIDGIESITVVEKQQNVIDLVWPYIPHDKIQLVHGNVVDFLSMTDDCFDIVYFDVNPGGMKSFPRLSDQLCSLSQRCLKPEGKVMFWEEDGG